MSSIKSEDNKQKKINQTIENHLIALDKQLEEKELFSFWCFPDTKGFKKIKNTNSTDIQKMIKKDVEKYKNRKIAKISIVSKYKDKTQFSFRNGIWLVATITIFQIDENGILTGRKNPSWGCDIQWQEDDFRVSKISFKLLERIMHITADKKHTCISAFGIQLSKIVKDLKKKKIDISDLLVPLSGI